jgi:GntR family transcriptional regulator
MKLPIQIEENSREPIYHQIETQLMALIVSGHLKPGDSLPSIRTLAKDLSCSVITTRRAYSNLEQSGYIKTSQGKGTFVAVIEEGKIAETKKITVMQTLERAVKVALQHDYTLAEIKDMFEEIIKRYMEEKNERDTDQSNSKKGG